jgi:CubicO group peptidase (beta-lactamase class C family)
MDGAILGPAARSTRRQDYDRGGGSVARSVYGCGASARARCLRGRYGADLPTVSRVVRAETGDNPDGGTMRRLMAVLAVGLVTTVAAVPASAQRHPAAAAPASAAQVQPVVPADMDAFTARVLHEFATPGVAIAVVRDGRTVFAKGYGVRRLGSPEPVTDRTLFQVASNSKAFTSGALAILVEEGRLHWTDRVVDVLPWFQMSDPYVTREMTVLDLLVHRSGLGLGAGDLLWFHSNYGRNDIIRRLRWVPLENGFRATYNYDNVLYPVAGAVVEAVSGKTWDAFVHDRIFVPLGMTSSVTSVAAIPAGEMAAPHGTVDGRLQVVPLDSADNLGPGASVVSSAADMAQWVRVQLDSGRVDAAHRLWSAQRTTELWTGRITTSPPRGANLAMYALGWNVYDFHGYKVVTHTGGLAGMISRVMLIPQLRTGFVILTNAESSAMGALTDYLRDFYTGAPAADYVQRYRQADESFDETAFQARLDSVRNPARGPALPLAGYAGTYHDAWYGDVTLAEEQGHLVIRFVPAPAFTGDLEHWQYDTFRVHWRVRSLPDAFVTFALRPDGTVDIARMAAVSPSTDFSYDWQDLLLVPVRPAGREH